MLMAEKQLKIRNMVRDSGSVQKESSMKTDRQTPCVIAISGVKNSGKTTFIERLIPCIRRRGWKVAVIKHDGHIFEPDVPGTDSYRLRQAGADGVAVYCDSRWMIVREEPGELEDLLRQFSDVDIILLEGAKASLYPKIELVRGAVSAQPVCDTTTLLALATDTDCSVPGVRRIGIGDYERAAELICEAAGATVTEAAEAATKTDTVAATVD